MYICPICNKEFLTEGEIKKHSLPCWKKENPHHKSKRAPQGGTTVIKSNDDGIINFLQSFGKED